MNIVFLSTDLVKLTRQYLRLEYWIKLEILDIVLLELIKKYSIDIVYGKIVSILNVVFTYFKHMYFIAN